MKKLLFIMLLIVATPAMPQFTGYFKQTGQVVDAETGKPLQGTTVRNSRSRVQTDKEGRYTIEYHIHDSDLRIYVSHPGYCTDTFGFAPELVRLRPLPKDSIQRRNDNNFHERQIERLGEANTLEDRANVYYQDFIYCNFGYTNPYFPFPEWDENTELRTPTFPHSADSALAILYKLYWQDDKENLYYPIVQLEHYLGLRHDDAVIPPDTSEYYVPIQSNAGNANLDPGWETDYSQHLMLYTEWALRFCKGQTNYLRELGEPDLWHSRDTVVRMEVDHLPGSGSTLIRVNMEKGKPMAHKYYCYSQYSTKDSAWHQKVYNHKKIKLTTEQWQEVLRLSDTIDSLPWYDPRLQIDGNWYFFEYRHGDSYRSHYTCSDDIRLSDYLWDLFDKPKRKKKE